MTPDVATPQPLGPASYITLAAALVAAVIAGLTAWQNAPDWVPIILAALSTLNVTVFASGRYAQAVRSIKA